MAKVFAYLEQQAFRFRDDDGSETGATWRADLNTDITIDANSVNPMSAFTNRDRVIVCSPYWLPPRPTIS